MKTLYRVQISEVVDLMVYAAGKEHAAEVAANYCSEYDFDFGLEGITEYTDHLGTGIYHPIYKSKSGWPHLMAEKETETDGTR
jgi:hypothetical protein